MDFADKSNGFIGVKQFTNDRFYAEAFVPDPNSTEEVDAFTVAQLRPGLDINELMGVILKMPVPTSFSDGKPRYYYDTFVEVAPIMYKTNYIEDMCGGAFNLGELDETYGPLIYDAITGRVFKLKKGQVLASFEKILEYREKYRRGN